MPSQCSKSRRPVDKSRRKQASSSASTTKRRTRTATLTKLKKSTSRQSVKMCCDSSTECTATVSSTNNCVSKTIRCRRKRRKNMKLGGLEPKFAGGRNSPDASSLPSPPTKWICTEKPSTGTEGAEKSSTTAETSKDTNFATANNDDPYAYELCDPAILVCTKSLKRKALTDFERFTEQLYQEKEPVTHPCTKTKPELSLKKPKCMANFNRKQIRPKPNSNPDEPTIQSSLVTIDNTIKRRNTRSRTCLQNIASDQSPADKSNDEQLVEPNIVSAPSVHVDRGSKSSNSKNSSHSSRKRRKRAKSIALSTESATRA